MSCDADESVTLAKKICLRADGSCACYKQLAPCECTDFLNLFAVCVLCVCPTQTSCLLLLYGQSQFVYTIKQFLATWPT